jgi:peptidoglycan/LPS O-acetylase OafA/YrhL
MPEPITRDRRYMPGLDGLRALAVIAVIVYHLGFGWASGGLLGVAVFFTLSGYLITDLLLSQYAAGRLQLREFWLARARRLLPALFVMLVVVSLWVWADDRAQLAVVRGEVFAGVFYISNWWQSFQHVSYFARFGPPSPLNHLWSLAVEEQFYIVWPWLLLLGIRLTKERRALQMRVRLGGVILLLACASAAEMAILYRPGFDPTRVYTGTDTRAFGLLLGAAFACVWPSRSLRPTVGRHAAWLLDVVGCVGLAGIAVMIFTTSEYSPFIYHGGLVLASVFSVMAIAALTHPASQLGRLLGSEPLRWIGVRSYGLYLWHEPVIALTTPNANLGVQPLRASLQVGGAVLLAALSWRYVENPIRHHALHRLWRRVRSSARRARSLALTLAPISAVVAFAILGISGAIASPPLTPVVALAAGNPGARANPGATSTADPSKRSLRTTTAATTPASTHTTTTTPLTTPHAKGSGPLRTSCSAVVHIGDSTSLALISNDYLPDPKQQMPAQYRRVGVKTSKMEITAGTSIVETLPGGLNAQTVASDLIHHGYHGCWVIALGTNDVADVAVGSNVSLAQRIKKMMAIIGKQPVMWVDVKTLLTSGPYAESGMQKWNAALISACARHPNMRVYNWAAAVKDKWFYDGIHYYSDGTAARAHLIANALAEAFPANGPPPKGCVVSTRSLSIPVLGIPH